MGLVADSAQGNPASKRCSWPAKSKLESSTVRRVSTASGPQSSASPCPVCACCLVRRQTRVRTRVKVCLHTPPFAAARCNLSPCDLQPVSAWRNSSRVVWPDFNPRPQVRSLPGPADLQGHCVGSTALCVRRVARVRRKFPESVRNPCPVHRIRRDIAVGSDRRVLSERSTSS
jgi:hypothetical protein